MIAVFFSIIQVTQANDQKHRNFPKTPAHTPYKMCKNKEFAEKSLAALMELATVLGLLQQDVEEKVEIDDELAALIEERQQARKEKNFARADEIRDMLKARGLILKDTPQGVQIIKE